MLNPLPESRVAGLTLSRKEIMLWALSDMDWVGEAIVANPINPKAMAINNLVMLFFPCPFD
jgi:hypothetical protein